MSYTTISLGNHVEKCRKCIKKPTLKSIHCGKPHCGKQMAEIRYKSSGESDFNLNTLLTLSTKLWLTPHKAGTCTSETNLYPYASHSVARCVGPIQSSRGLGLHRHINFPILIVSDLSQRSMPAIMHNMLWCTKTRGHDSAWSMMNTPWATHISMTLFKLRLNLPMIQLPFSNVKPAHLV